jgi:hypothetical protein
MMGIDEIKGMIWYNEYVFFLFQGVAMFPGGRKTSLSEMSSSGAKWQPRQRAQ